MATPAQTIANRSNALASTGPATVEGKSRSSRNSITSGLFSATDFVRPGEQEIYTEFCDAYQSDLSPDGAIEHTLAAEIVHAAWRLRRCSTLEAALTEFDDRTQHSIDRARASAFRIYTRSINELRKIQTVGPAPAKPAEPAVDEAAAFRNRSRELYLQATANFTKRTQSDPAPAPLTTPRGAPCTCGSGIKFKRCCGKDAPPVLNMAA
jgi:uncharacterized protein YchJ